jgi:hypothetical protein
MKELFGDWECQLTDAPGYSGEYIKCYDSMCLILDSCCADPIFQSETSKSFLTQKALEVLGINRNRDDPKNYIAWDFYSGTSPQLTDDGIRIRLEIPDQVLSNFFYELTQSTDYSKTSIIRGFKSINKEGSNAYNMLGPGVFDFYFLDVTWDGSISTYVAPNDNDDIKTFNQIYKIRCNNSIPNSVTHLCETSEPTGGQF